MGMKLNIIGNGFDLYHGLPTSYYYFACYVLSHDEEFYDAMAEMYGFYKGINKGYPYEEIERAIDDIGYWKYFEEKLGELAPDWIEDSLIDELDLEDPDAVDLEVEGTQNPDEIKQRLNDWIDDVIDRKSNYKIVKKNIGSARLKFDGNDNFISFNYTHTLEEVYGVEKVFHIHGEGHSVEKPIIGHGNDKIIQDLRRRVEELSGNDFDQETRNRENEYRAEIEVLDSLRKPVDDCLAELGNFMKDIETPEIIRVWGLSLSDVDIPYLKKIRKKFMKSKWSFSFFDNDSFIHKAAHVIGIDKQDYDCFLLKNDNCKEIIDKIVKIQNIKTFSTLDEKRKQLGRQ